MQFLCYLSVKMSVVLCPFFSVHLFVKDRHNRWFSKKKKNNTVQSYSRS